MSTAPAAPIEILYFDGCPNWQTTRAMLDRLVAEEGRARKIIDVAIEDEASAIAHRFLGSPTVRIAGRDIEPGAEQRSDYGMRCRIYRTPQAVRGTPREAWIRVALGQPG